MVRFVMDSCKDLQGLGNGQGSICVVIITVRLLHVHMLEIIQLMCCVGLRTHRVCIPKALQLLAIGAPGKFVASTSIIYLLKFAFLIALNFDNEIGSKPAFSPIAFTSNNMSFHFVHVGRTFFTTFSLVVSMRVLCSIALVRGIMMVAKIAIACLVASLGFF